MKSHYIPPPQVSVDHIPEVFGYKVELTYFQPGGKYYSLGSYTSDCEHVFEIHEEVRKLKNLNKLPGLIGGWEGMVILIGVPEHPHNCPRLMLDITK